MRIKQTLMNTNSYNRRREGGRQESNQMVFGIRAVIEAIKSGREIESLYIKRGLTGGIIQELKSMLREHELGYQVVPVEKLNRLTSKNHQGTVAFISPTTFEKLENIIPA